VALETLAGPLAIVNAAGTPLTISNGAAAFYDDALGLCTYSAALGGYSIVQLNGKTYMRCETSRANRYTLDLQRPGEYLVHASLFEDALYTFDKRAGVFGELLLSGGTNFVLDLQVRAADRYLNVLNNAVRFKPLDNSGSWSTEATLTDAGSGQPTVSRTRKAGVLCFVYTDGHVVYYDTVNKAQSAGKARLGTNSGAWYSPKRDVFVAIVSNQLKVFANAIRPAALSNPVAVTPFTRGKVSQVKVQLTGSTAEPCPGEIIEWSMTGVGSLAAAQSVTDADGWAYNDYLAPADGVGSATIDAMVQF
jgi:hypothetical protein